MGHISALFVEKIAAVAASRATATSALRRDIFQAAGLDPASLSSANKMISDAAFFETLEWVVRRPEVQTLYESFCRQRLRVLEEIVGACGKGTLDDSEVPAVAATLMAAIEGAFLMSTAAPGAIPSGSAAPTLRRAARALVGGGS